MLTLPIKKKWFDMILNRIKTEEYREIKPYYTTRFKNVLGLAEISDSELISWLKYTSSEPFKIKFVNGYGGDKPYFIAEICLTIDTGYEDWGAEPNKEYYVLFINKIIDARVHLNSSTPYSEISNTKRHQSTGQYNAHK